MTAFYIVTLGCKVNQYETQALREAWLAEGCIEVDTPQKAEVCIVNSCAITAKAVADVRATIRKLHREQPMASLVVTGCAAEVMEKELAGIEGVTQTIRRKDKASLLVKGALKLILAGSPLVAQESRSSLVAKAFPPFFIRDYDRSRAVLKIQDGCSHCCTYCIVPRARGGSVSRPLYEALDEAGRLLEAGFAEIVISGVNLRQFQIGSALEGEEVADEAFWRFIEALEERFATEWEGRARFRISSLEPGQLTERAIHVLGKSRLIAPHLHLSLQSGSDSVLSRMGRGHYTVHDVRDGLAKLSQVWRPFALGADIISGFPGETDTEHAETVALLHEIPLTYAHVFPYSQRPMTIAAKMAGQVDNACKKERAATLRHIAAEKQRQFALSLLKQEVFQVAVERKLNTDGRAHGVNEWYVDCEFTESIESELSARPSGKGAVLVTARPLRVEGQQIIVVPAG